jgi:hypothetical protein
MSYTVQTALVGRLVLDAGASVVVLTPDLERQFAEWFGDDHLGLFDVPGGELQAHGREVVTRHHNPRCAPASVWPRPQLPRLESLMSTTIGTRVLVLTRLVRVGDTYVRGIVTATPDSVLLADGTVAPASTVAAELLDREGLPSDGKAELSVDGAAWRRNKDGVTRLPRFCGAPTTLGALASAGAASVIVAGAFGKWRAVEIA